MQIEKDSRSYVTSFLLAFVAGLFLIIFANFTTLTSLSEIQSTFLLFLFFLIHAGVVEEGFKFLSISLVRGGVINGLFAGFGFALVEQFLKHTLIFFYYGGPEHLLKSRFFAVTGMGFFIHMTLAAWVGYEIERGHPWRGLISAIILHALFNTLVSI